HITGAARPGDDQRTIGLAVIARARQRTVRDGNALGTFLTTGSRVRVVRHGAERQRTVGGDGEGVVGRFRANVSTRLRIVADAERHDLVGIVLQGHDAGYTSSDPGN